LATRIVEGEGIMLGYPVERPGQVTVASRV
jgi:hypothetical protein